MMEKQCTKCGETKSLFSFHKRPETKDGRRKDCKLCFAKASAKRWANLEEKERQRRNKKIRLKYNYNLSPEEYDKLVEDQDGKCYICGNEANYNGKPLYVDHCHDSGKVRKLLCQHCNSGLGMFRDNPELLIKAADYLKEHSG
jgi:hypothetical protein